jgi:hypothetical protein
MTRLGKSNSSNSGEGGRGGATSTATALTAFRLTALLPVVPASVSPLTLLLSVVLTAVPALSSLTGGVLFFSPLSLLSDITVLGEDDDALLPFRSGGGLRAGPLRPAGGCGWTVAAAASEGLRALLWLTTGGDGDRDFVDDGDSAAALSAKPMAAFLAADLLATVLLPLASSGALV